MSAKSFVVFGLGKFGYSVAVSLYKNGCDVLAVDCDEEKVEDIARDVTYAVKANVIDPDIYESLGIGNMDGAVIAISDNIEASIMAAITPRKREFPMCSPRLRRNPTRRYSARWGQIKSFFQRRQWVPVLQRIWYSESLWTPLNCQRPTVWWR